MMYVDLPTVELFPAAERVKGHDSPVEPQVICVEVSPQSTNDTNKHPRSSLIL